MAESDRLVRVVMILAARTIASACNKPAWPTTWPKRRNMITPRIVSVQGVNTPANVPKPRLCVSERNAFDFDTAFFFGETLLAAADSDTYWIPNTAV